MQHRELVYNDSKISYWRFGSGTTLVVCFHGYGENGKHFEFLESGAGNQFSFLAPDLPFHGKTEWPAEQNFLITDLENIISLMLKNEGLEQYKNKLYLLGFSLGGRIALRLYQANPSVQKMVLLAPDGLKMNFWYWLSTQTWIGNRLFEFTMKHPEWFFGFLKILNRLGLVNASIFKFVNYYIGDKSARYLLFARWTSLRKLSPDLQQIKKQIRDNKTVVRLIYGKHDRIILASVGERFCAGIESQCQLIVIPSGHQVLHEKNSAAIISALSD